MNLLTPEEDDNVDEDEAGVNTLMDVGVRQTPLSHMIEESTFVFLFEHFVFFFSQSGLRIVVSAPQVPFFVPIFTKSAHIGK